MLTGVSLKIHQLNISMLFDRLFDRYIQYNIHPLLIRYKTTVSDTGCSSGVFKKQIIFHVKLPAHEKQTVSLYTVVCIEYQ